MEAILLAAGTSSRMSDKNKMGLSYRGEPFLVHAVKQLLATMVTKIIVVIGHEAEWAKKQLANYDVEVVVNEQYRQGQLSSLQLGLRHLSPTCKSYLVTLADMPLLTTAHYQQMIDLYVEKESAILVPHNGQFAGHPKLFAATFTEDLLQLSTAKDQGAKPILKQFTKQVTFFSTQEEAYFFDVDTPEDYHYLIQNF